MKVDGGLALTMVVSGLLCVPLFGWLPMLAIGAAIGMAVYIANNMPRPK